MGLGDAQGMRTSVGVEEHGQWRTVGVDVVGEQDGDRQIAIADGEDLQVRLDQWRLAERLDLVVAGRCARTMVVVPGRSSVAERTTMVSPPMAAPWMPGSEVMAWSSSVAPAHCQTWSWVASSIGLAQNVMIGAWASPLVDTTDRTWSSGGVTGSSATSRRRVPSRSPRHHEPAVGEPGRRARNQLDPGVVVVVREHGGLPRVEASLVSTSSTIVPC